MSQERAAEQAVLQEALARGWLSPVQVDEAMRWRDAEVAAGRPGALLAYVGERFLTPEQRGPLRDVYTQAHSDFEADATYPPRAVVQRRSATPAPGSGSGLQRSGRGQASGSGSGLQRSGSGSSSGGGLADRLAKAFPGLSAPPLPRDGERVGRYRILRELARGGMGAVYVALDEELGQERALKVTFTGPNQSDQSRARFRREAKSAARLDHPGVVRVHELGTDEEGREFLVMDLVAGRPLDERIEAEGPLDMDEAARIAAEVADALQAAHEQGVVHRDIKPSNVLLTPRTGAAAAGAGSRERPVITDFGIAKMVVDQSQVLSKTGQVLGTPAFMAPEQARGDHGQVGPATDVYALGATLYAMLTGDGPFIDLSPFHLLVAVLDQTPDPPSTRRPGLDPALDAICLRCLAKAPEERYASAAEVAGELRAWLEGEAPAAAGPRLLPRLALALVAVSLLLGLGWGGLALLDPPASGEPGPDARAPGAGDEEDSQEAPSGPASFTWEVALDGGEGATRALQVGEEDVLLELTLEAHDPGDWRLLGAAAGPPASAVEAEHLTPAGGGVLRIHRESAIPLRPGPYHLRVVGPPRGQATVHCRALPAEEAAGDPLVEGDPRPDPARLLSPENVEPARALMERYYAAEGEEARFEVVGELTTLGVLDTHPLSDLFAPAVRASGGDPNGEYDARLAARALWEDHPKVFEVCYYVAQDARSTDSETWETALRRALAQEPGYRSLHWQLSRDLQRQGRHEEALEAALEYLARAPTDGSANRIASESELYVRPRAWRRALPHARLAWERFVRGGTKLFVVDHLSDALWAARTDEPARAAEAAEEVLGWIGDRRLTHEEATEAWGMEDPHVYLKFCAVQAELLGLARGTEAARRVLVPSMAAGAGAGGAGLRRLEVAQQRLAGLE